MSKRDAFDLSDVSDLPETLRPRRAGPGVPRVECGRPKSLYEELLLAAGRAVSAPQVHAAIYRTKNRVVTRRAVHIGLLKMLNDGIAVQPERGLYLHRKFLPAGVSNIRPKKRAA